MTAALAQPPSQALAREKATHSATADPIVLLYEGKSQAPWTIQTLLPYVAHVDTQGKPDDWFFDTILFISLAAPSGRAYYADSKRAPSNRSDWVDYMDSFLFGGRKEIQALDDTVTYVARELGRPRSRSNVIITIPYPDPSQKAFGQGDTPEKSLTFTRDVDRLEAVRWYLDAVLKRWRDVKPDSLDLVGFYWISERVESGDADLVKNVAKYVKQRRLLFYWIPYFGAASAADWKDLGVDQIFYQPNYFYHDLPEGRLADAMTFARDHDMGIEMECNEKILSSPELRDKYRAYLNYGVEYGFDADDSAFYQGVHTFLDASRSQDREVRSLYDDTYLFVKGKYQTKAKVHAQ